MHRGFGLLFAPHWTEIRYDIIFIEGR